MKTNLSKAFLCAALAPLLLVTHAFGAVILWDATATSVDVNNPLQVSTSGTLFGAEYMYGDVNSTPLTVNGVTFTDTAAIFIPAFGYQQNGSSTSGIDYETLLAGGYYLANANSAVGNFAIQLSGLTFGETYQVQAWTPYWPANFNTRFSSSLPDGATNSHAPNESPSLVLGVGAIPPQYVLGTFTADATTQNINYYGDNGYGVFGAVQVRDITGVPEPTTISLLSLGGLALILRRRQRLAVS